MATEPDDDGIEDEKAHQQRRRVERPPAANYRDEDEDDDDRPRRRRRRSRDDDYDDEPAGIGEDAGMRMLLPVGRSIWAIIAGYFGLLSVILFPAPFALIFGIIAVIDIKNNPKKHGMGRAIFAIAMGLIFSAILTVVLFAEFANQRRRF